MPAQSARQNSTNSELDAKQIVTNSGLTSAQKDELIAQYSQLIVDSMDVESLEQFVYNTLTDDYSKLSDSELKDEIKYTFDEETLEELVDNITATDPIVYNTNKGNSFLDINNTGGKF